MRRGFPRVPLAGLFLLLPASAWAAQPALPTDEAGPADPSADTGPADPGAGDPGVDAAPADGAGDAAPPDGGGDAALEGSGGFEVGGDAGGDDPFAVSSDGDVAADGDGEGAAGDDADPALDDDPGNVQGRREPMMPTNRGGIGLFHTTLPDAGGKMTFRFRMHTDFFRKEGFIYEGPDGPDQQARVRGGVALGFSPAKWGEIFFSVNSSANRNERVQEGRQDAEAIFALGDIDFGFKGAHRFKNGIGVGGQAGLGLLSGSSRLLTSNVNFWLDGLFAVDVRYLTKKQFPFRFTTNIGWMLDNSLRVAPYLDITDPVSREVTRFALGGNHSRVRMRYAIDFPVRLGKERKFGIDPILEYAWDVSTVQEDVFLREGTQASALPRSSQWMTIGLRANVISGLHVSAAADIGLVSPSFEFGPPVPPWQMMLGLGWSFDPTPIIKEVPVESEAPAPIPQPVIEGRIIGAVVDPDGNPVGDARIQFPGLASGAIVTDASGNFTSYRFPAGTVAMQVLMNGEVVHEASADIVDGQDTQVQIQLETGPAPATGIVRGAFIDEAGKPVKVRMQVVGQGVDEPFDSTPEGLIALELYAGEYRGTITAPGYTSKTITFTVPEDGNVEINESLSLDQAPETPNVSGTDRSIRLKQRIRYDKKNQVSPKSHAILDELATFLKYHPEYAVVRVDTHTDDRGAAKTRTDQRGESVKAYLTSKGVEAGRLQTKSYGSSKPVAVNLTAAGRSKNNRTAFTVVTKN